MLTQNLPEFWENLYIEHKDYWNLGKATPALLDFFNLSLIHISEPTRPY